MALHCERRRGGGGESGSWIRDIRLGIRSGKGARQGLGEGRLVVTPRSGPNRVFLNPCLAPLPPLSVPPAIYWAWHMALGYLDSNNNNNTREIVSARKRQRQRNNITLSDIVSMQHFPSSIPSFPTPHVAYCVYIQRAPLTSNRCPAYRVGFTCRWPWALFQASSSFYLYRRFLVFFGCLIFMQWMHTCINIHVVFLICFTLHTQTHKHR